MRPDRDIDSLSALPVHRELQTLSGVNALRGNPPGGCPERHLLLIGGIAVFHLLRRAITAAILAVTIVIGLVYIGAALLYLGGLALLIGGTIPV
jgi:hypothetical protein